MILEFLRSLNFRLPKVAAFPTVRADDDDEEEELHDPLTGLRAKCTATPEGTSLKQKLDECNTRVRSRKKTKETCEEELHDFFHYIDNCAAKTLFDYLK